MVYGGAAQPEANTYISVQTVTRRLRRVLSRTACIVGASKSRPKYGFSSHSVQNPYTFLDDNLPPANYRNRQRLAETLRDLIKDLHIQITSLTYATKSSRGGELGIVPVFYTSNYFYSRRTRCSATGFVRIIMGFAEQTAQQPSHLCTLGRTITNRFNITSYEIIHYEYGPGSEQLTAENKNSIVQQQVTDVYVGSQYWRSKKMCLL